MFFTNDGWKPSANVYYCWLSHLFLSNFVPFILVNFYVVHNRFIRKPAAQSRPPGWVNGMYDILGHLNLVGGFKHFLLSIIYGIILPID